MIHSAQVEAGPATIYYSYTDTGKAGKLLVFHGYGQDREKMQALVKHAQYHDLYLVDLPGHGKTESDDISLEDWSKALVEMVGQERVGIFGYSLGGSVALAMLKFWPEKIDQLILAAPSGIGNDALYDFAVHTGIGRKLLAQFVKSPWFINVPLRFLETLKLIPESLAIFLRSKTDSKEKRGLLFQRWMQCRNLRISANEAIHLLKKNNTKITLIGGSQDTFVTPKQVKKFAKKVPHARYIEMDAGHRLYEESVVKKICDLVKI